MTNDPANHAPNRLLVPLPRRAAAQPTCCPVCGAPREPDSPGVSFHCGAGWPPGDAPLPCPRPPAALVLAELRRWCRQEELLEAAAFLRRRLARSGRPQPRRRSAPAWLLPTRSWEEPPTDCPTCTEPVAAIQPGRWYYRCGAMLLELPTDDQERASRWRAVEPCQRPPVGAVLAALASQPDCPLVPTDLQRLEGLMHGTRWI